MLTFEQLKGLLSDLHIPYNGQLLELLLERCYRLFNILYCRPFLDNSHNLFHMIDGDGVNFGGTAAEKNLRFETH
jgi:hypothetical protein